MATNQVKSKQRVRDHGEVFTPDFIVNDTLVLKPDRKPLGPARQRSDLLMIANIAAQASWKARPAVSILSTLMLFRSTRQVRHRQTERPSFSLSPFASRNAAIMTKPSAEYARANVRRSISIVSLTEWREALNFNKTKYGTLQTLSLIHI